MKIASVSLLLFLLCACSTKTIIPNDISVIAEEACESQGGLEKIQVYGYQLACGQVEAICKKNKRKFVIKMCYSGEMGASE